MQYLGVETYALETANNAPSCRQHHHIASQNLGCHTDLTSLPHNVESLESIPRRHIWEPRLQRPIYRVPMSHRHRGRQSPHDLHSSTLSQKIENKMQPGPPLPWLCTEHPPKAVHRTRKGYHPQNPWDCPELQEAAQLRETCAFWGRSNAVVGTIASQRLCDAVWSPRKNRRPARQCIGVPHPCAGMRVSTADEGGGAPEQRTAHAASAYTTENGSKH